MAAGRCEDGLGSNLYSAAVQAMVGCADTHLAAVGDGKINARLADVRCLRIGRGDRREGVSGTVDLMTCRAYGRLDIPACTVALSAVLLNGPVGGAGTVVVCRMAATLLAGARPGPQRVHRR